MKVKRILFVAVAVLLCAVVLVVALHKRNDRKNDGSTQDDIVIAPELIPETETDKNEKGKSLSLPAENESVEPLENPEEISDEELAYEDRFLLVINAGYSLSDSYVPHLEEAVANSGIYLEKQAAEAFSQMYADALGEGVMLTPVIGYTSISRQQKLFEEKTALYAEQGYTEEDAKALAAKTVLPAGCSEHNAGLAVDIGEEDDSFASSPAYRWLSENAYKYGFIERYRAEYADFTGMDAQPWHWRYVGSDINARKINESGLSLEEWVIETDNVETPEKQ